MNGIVEIDISCENMFDRGGLDEVFVGVGACIAKIAQVFAKVSDKAWSLAYNGIFLFVRSRLTVHVMYWARAEDYFYPFHEVCMHLLYAAEAALQSGQEIIVEGTFWKLMNDVVDGGFETQWVFRESAVNELGNRFNCLFPPHISFCLTLSLLQSSFIFCLFFTLIKQNLRCA